MTWPISFDGIGPLLIGEDAAAATSAFEALHGGESGARCASNWQIVAENGSSVDLWFAVDESGKATAVEAVSIASFRAPIDRATASTSEGVGIGSMMDDVAEAYPEGVRSIGDASVTGYDYENLDVTRGDRDLAFAADPLFAGSGGRSILVDRVAVSVSGAAFGSCE